MRGRGAAGQAATSGCGAFSVPDTDGDVPLPTPFCLRSTELKICILAPKDSELWLEKLRPRTQKAGVCATLLKYSTALTRIEELRFYDAIYADSTIISKLGAIQSQTTSSSTNRAHSRFSPDPKTCLFSRKTQKICKNCRSLRTHRKCRSAPFT